MEWVSNNWFFLLFAALFIGMHVFGFGCCGGHGKHGKHEEESTEKEGHTGSTDGSTEEKGQGSCH